MVGHTSSQNWEGRTPLTSAATLSAEFQTASGSNVSKITVRQELHERGSIAVQQHTGLKSLCTMPSFGSCGVKHATIGLWSSEK